MHPWPSEVGVGWLCHCPGTVWEPIRKRAHKQLNNSNNNSYIALRPKMSSQRCTISKSTEGQFIQKNTEKHFLKCFVYTYNQQLKGNNSTRQTRTQHNQLSVLVTVQCDRHMRCGVVVFTCIRHDSRWTNSLSIDDSNAFIYWHFDLHGKACVRGNRWPVHRFVVFPSLSH